MGRFVYLFIISLMLLCGCKSPGSNSPEEMQEEVNVSVPSLEDTIRYQIGGKLFSPIFNPEDSITVIKKYYSYFREDDFLYREYHFIVHNTDTPEHDVFKTERIDEFYREDKVEDEFNFHLSGQDTIKVEYISPAIEKYKGYWIDLHYLGDQDDYFLFSYMGGLENFCITDSLYLKLMMDGVYPYRIISFEEDGEEGFKLKYPGSIDLEIEEIHFRLIDKEREVYGDPYNRHFITPSRNANKFKVVVSVNNTGELI